MVKTQTLSSTITRLAERAGIRERTRLKEGQKSGGVRKTVPRAHGFRKAFTTLTINSKMDPIKRNMLEGHSIGIDSPYYKPSDADLLEEYQTKAMDCLTINEENRLKRELEVSKEKQDELLLIKMEHRREMEEMQERIELKFRQIVSMIDTKKLT